LKDNTEKLKREIKIEIEKGLYILDKKLEKDAEKIKENLSKDISLILKDIKKQQEENKIGIIDSMIFVLSFTEIYNRNYVYPVFLYGKKTYIDEYETEFYLDVSLFYNCLESIQERALNLSKKYTREEFSMSGIKREIFINLQYFNMFIVKELKKVFQDENILKLLKSLVTTDSFVIIQNEMYEKPYSIYKKKGNDLWNTIV